ncbi:hypothetical protein M2480_002916 [Parabacteroides sp. PFB2-12]|uniref:hypothetical protein n=1 Tax=unclassified Parabacteroides TaxID=2649774 RepID=UPI002473C885|nr:MULTISPECIES: hypothetical protein [unclassified Parabacteroides]MDH6343751.1 hypothetical protein [Parabacteroides sp. PM6-13]MDH6391913.1 hypothetical protein [Parabacteroides sp. PFB2-12]
MKQTSKQLHQESIDYITNNINANTTEIPKHLLEYWHTSEDVDVYSKSDTSISFFLIFLHAIETYNETLGKKVELSSLNAAAMFGLFQILIGLELGVETKAKCDPINLFDFESYPKQILKLAWNGYL